MILLDTHVVLWWQAGGQRLSAAATRELARAETILVSPISCWEITVLLDRGRFALDRDVFRWTREFFDQDRVEVAPLTPHAAVRAGRLDAEGFQGDPADRFLYATAEGLTVPFLTKDRTIREFARASRSVRCIW